MFKLKIKRADQTTSTTKYFNTLQEVAYYLHNFLNISTLDNMLREQTENNFRFYLSYKKEK